MLINVQEFKRYKMAFSIIIVDIDDFKKVNDTYGHDIGDYVLQNISEVLKQNIRICDVVGRWGGEEFVIICENTNLEQVYIVAEHLRQIIENKVFDVVGSKTISLGIAQFGESDTINTIFKRADNSLYVAKNSGKNKVGILY